MISLRPAVLIAAGVAALLPAQVIRTNPGFSRNEIARNDDGSSSLAPLGFTINFFGKPRSAAYVNNNGNITFDAALPTYTPFGLQKTNREIIAAFFADVDTRGANSKLVTYGQDFVDNHKAFAANYVDVGYFASHDDKLNRFQLVVVDRSETGNGNFDIEFNYERIAWETGDASGGTNGFGGVPAAVGWSNGATAEGTSFELPGSMVSGAFLDGGPRALIRARLNNPVVGRLLFRARDGVLSPGLSVTTGPALPDATVGQPYSFAFQFAGVQGAGRWELLPDVVAPPGLSLSASGALTGVPTAPGTYSFTVSVTATVDGESQTAYRRSSIVIQAPRISITTACPLGDGTVGVPYSVSLQARGNHAPVVWSVENRYSLPPGISLSSSGAFQGIPQAPGTYDFLLRAETTDTIGTEPAARSCRVTSHPAAVQLASGCALPDATVGVPYAQTIHPSGGAAPYRFEWAGQLPPGLNLSASGAMTGTPTVPGAYPFRLIISGGQTHSASQDCAIQVNAPVVSAAASCPLPEAQTSADYSAALRASGGTPPYTWSLAGTLPPGLILSPDGVISGRPTSAGPFLFRLLTVDAAGNESGQPCSIRVVRGPLSVGNCPLPTAASGQPYLAQLSAVGGVEPYIWTSTGQLPPGLALSSSGVISGTATDAGTYNFGVSLRDGSYTSATQTCSLRIEPQRLRIATSCPVRPAVLGNPYSTNFTATGGTPPYQFTFGGFLPDGLASASDGTVSGTPQRAGTTSFLVRAEDAAGGRSETICSIEVGLGDPPQVRISDIPSKVDAGRPDFAIGVELAQPYRLPVSGLLHLAVTPDTRSPDGAANQADPHLRFANGQLAANFTIPPGTTRVNVPLASTGTVAGSVVAFLSGVSAGGVDVPLAATPRVFQVPASAPVVSSACYVPQGAGVELSVLGYSTTREMKSADISTSLGTVTINLSDIAAEYYAREETIRAGGAFSLRVPYAQPLAGTASVRLTNTVGSSSPVSVSRCP
jgi:hypothetical protein